jgi:hypothetical protein
MKMSTKSTYIILGTLIIGIVIGILGGGILHQKRFERFEDMRRMKPEQRFSEMIDEIVRPNENQRKLIKDVLEKQAEKIAELDEVYHGKILTIFDSTRQVINSSLNEEQIKRLEERINKGSEQFVKRHLQRLDQVLDLTKDQSRQIEEILKKFKPPFRQAKKLSFDRQGKNKTKFKNHMDEMDSEIETVLTPEQIEKFNRFKERRPKNRGDHRPGDFPPPFDDKLPKEDF